MKTPAHLAKLVDEDPQQKRRRRFCYAGWHAEDSKSIAIVFRAKDRKWHGPARDRQNAAAGTIQYGEQNRCGGGFKQADDCGINGMQCNGRPRRHHRVKALREARLEEPNPDLRGTDERARCDRLDSAGRFEQLP
jgi:hypothetical protein